MKLFVAPWLLCSLVFLSLSYAAFAKDHIKTSSLSQFVSLADQIRANPGRADLYITRGNSYGRGKRFREAMADYSAAVTLAPDDW